MNKKRAFTLVELLVVVAIIGILSSLVTVGVMAAMQSAKRARIAMEMGQISLALESYKNKFGEYPPDLYDKQAVVRHVKKRWPRFQFPQTDLPSGSSDVIDIQYWCIIHAVGNVYKKLATVPGTNIPGANNFIDDTSDNDDALTVTRQASYIGAIPFWLGGFPNNDGRLAGFFADPEAPFGRDSSTNINNGNINFVVTNLNLTNPQDKDNNFYEMVVDKNIKYIASAGRDVSDPNDDIVFPCLLNMIRSDLLVPYVYFKSRSSNGGSDAYVYNNGTYLVPKYYDFNAFFTDDWKDIGVAVSYASGGNPFAASNPTSVSWHESQRFQLIHPGLDGHFGDWGSNTTNSPFRDEYFRTTKDADKNNIGQKDFDNITNFSDYQQIKSILP